MSLEIYHEQIIDHYKNPMNSGIIKNPDIVSKDFNSSCGDVIEIQIKLDDKKFGNIKFQGQGCAISQSSVDILIDLMKGKNFDDVVKLSQEEFLKKLGIELSPLRLKCALLGLKTLKTGIYTYLANEK